MQTVRVPERAPASSLKSAARASKVSINMKAIVCERLLASRLKELRSSSTDSIGAGARRENYKRRKTYINDLLDLPEYSRNGRTDERDSTEQTGLANEDVEQRLMNSDKLFLVVSNMYICGTDGTHFAEGFEDGISRSACGLFGHALHLSDGGGGGSYNVCEAPNDLGEWSLTDEEQLSTDNGDAFGRRLKRHALRRNRFNVGDNLSRRDSSRDRHGEGQGGGEEVAE